MSTFVDCTVLIDGMRAADGSPGESPTAPAILENLAVVWGRSDTMSQPPPDSCTFEVLDPVGGDAFTSLFRTGRRVDVVAHGDSFPEPSVPTFVNPGYERTEVTWATSGGTAAITTARVHSGTKALAVNASTVWLAPGEFQPPGTNPDAWDHIPTTGNGQTWASSVALWLPTGARAVVDGAIYHGPYASAGASVGMPQVVEGNGAWQTITAEWEVSPPDRWVGFYITVSSIGPTWDELPPLLTWDGVDPSLTWDDQGTLYVDDSEVISPDIASGKGVLVFSGRITDISASWDEGAGAPIAQVAAEGFTADLENRNVGDEPWPVESVEARANRILDLASLPISIDIDSPIDDTLVSWRDIDSQGATGLLQNLAVSVDGVLWSAVHQSIGAYLRLEDPSLRTALLALVEELGPPPVIVATNTATNPDAEAFGAVATTRTNLAHNPRAATVGPIPSGTLGWQTRWYGTGGAGTFVAVTGASDGPIAGVTSYGRKTWTTAPTAPAGDAGFQNSAAYGTDAVLRTTGRPCSASTSYAFSAYLRMNRAAPVSFVISVVWRAADGSFISQQNIATISGLAAGVWNRISGVITSPATAAYVEAITSNSFSFAFQVGDRLEGTALLMESAAYVLPYIDGALPAAGDFTYSWSGAANATTSTQRAPGVAGVAAYSGGNAARWSSVVESSRGLRSHAVLRTGGASTGFIWNAPATLTADQYLTFRARAKAAPGVTFNLYARTQNGGGAGAVIYTGTGAWQDIYTAVLSGSSASPLIGAQLLVTSAAGTVFVDEELMVVDTAPYTGPYFDGNTQDTSAFSYAWTGAENASASTQSTVQTRTIVIEPADPDTGWNLSACVVLRDPVTWLQDVSDVATRVAVQWKVQGLNDVGEPETSDATEYEIDAGLEAIYGTRRVSVSTELQAAADAQNVAARILSRATPQGWRASGVTIDDEHMTSDAEAIDLMLNLLDGTSRIGAPLILGDLPAWSPAGSNAGVYLEGGAYRYIGGRWVLELSVSVSTGLGESAQWDQIDPTWTWDYWSPAITWNDLRGVSA